jgi:hypothetical protein
MIWEILAIRLEDDRLISFIIPAGRLPSIAVASESPAEIVYLQSCIFPVIGQGRCDSPLGSLLSMGAGAEFGYHVCLTTRGARNPTPGRYGSALARLTTRQTSIFHQTKQTRRCAKTLESCQLNGQVVRGATVPRSLQLVD